MCPISAQRWTGSDIRRACSLTTNKDRRRTGGRLGTVWSSRRGRLGGGPVHAPRFRRRAREGKGSVEGDRLPRSFDWTKPKDHMDRRGRQLSSLLRNSKGRSVIPMTPIPSGSEPSLDRTACSAEELPKCSTYVRRTRGGRLGEAVGGRLKKECSLAHPTDAWAARSAAAVASALCPLPHSRGARGCTRGKPRSRRYRCYRRARTDGRRSDRCADIDKWRLS